MDGKAVNSDGIVTWEWRRNIIFSDFGFLDQIHVDAFSNQSVTQFLHIAGEAICTHTAWVCLSNLAVLRFQF